MNRTPAADVEENYRRDNPSPDFLDVPSHNGPELIQELPPDKIAKA